MLGGQTQVVGIMQRSSSPHLGTSLAPPVPRPPDPGAPPELAPPVAGRPPDPGAPPELAPPVAGRPPDPGAPPELAPPVAGRPPDPGAPPVPLWPPDPGAPPVPLCPPVPVPAPHAPFTQTAGDVHCALVVHTLLQVSAVASQRPGAQLIAAGVTQIPAPSHAAGGVRVDALAQLAGLHCVPATQRAHCPPAHWPVVPQVACAWAAHRPRGSAPLLTLVQVPAVPARLQARQAVLQALLQQTPCEQKLLVHSAAAEHAAPNGLRPQLLTMPFMPQNAGAMH
jgi:hypothetical protein